MMNLLAIRSAAVLFLTCLLFAPLAADERLAAEIAAIMNGPDYRQAHWGLLFVDMETGQTVYEHNADQLFAPASTTKLYSVATALDALGADHRFRTPVVRRGDVDKDGELDGDLILVASGDLSLGGRTGPDGKVAFKNSDHTYAGYYGTAELTEPDPLAGLNDLARQVAASGVRRVRGEVMVDDRLFERAASSGSGPSRVTPIVVNDNVIDVLVTPTSAGSPAKVTWRPESAALQVDALVDTVEAEKPGGIRITSPGAGRLVVRGTVPAGSKPKLLIDEVGDPASWARSLFIEALRRAGVTVDASPLASNSGGSLPARDAVAQLPQVAGHTSPPFAEAARLVLKVSHNLHASTLPLLVAAKHGKRTLEEGLRLQRDFLARTGVDVETISFGGGAGGSPADFTTPRATVQLLRAMAKRPDFAVYEEAMPVLGVDGTLATSVGPDSPAKGKVRAKTGTYTVRNVLNDRTLLTSKALAGYLTTAKGHRLAFAAFVNKTHLAPPADSSREGKVLGRLCEIVYHAE